MGRALEPDVEAVFSRLLARSDGGDLAAARVEVGQYLAGFEAAARRNGLLPIDIARELAAGLESLLELAESLGGDERALVAAAARYFVSEEDARPDTDGVLGLDDDVAVFNHVVERLGMPERKLEL